MKERTAIGIIIGTICTFFIGVFIIFRYTSTSSLVPTHPEIDAFSSPQPHPSGEFRFDKTYIASESSAIDGPESNEISIDKENVGETEVEIPQDAWDRDELQALRNIFSTQIQELTVQIDTLTSQREEYREALQELQLGLSESISEFQRSKNELDDFYGPKPTQKEFEAYRKESSNIDFKMQEFTKTRAEESKRLVELLNDTIKTRRELYNERLLLQDLLEELDFDN